MKLDSLSSNLDTLTLKKCNIVILIDWYKVAIDTVTTNLIEFEITIFKIEKTYHWKLKLMFNDILTIPKCVNCQTLCSIKDDTLY